jgi:hypothetical protein
MTADLLKLPWEIQVAIASGYGAYVIAYTGLRSRHKAVDVVMLTLVFGLIATAVLGLVPSEIKPIWRGGLAVLLSVISGLIWRRWGRSLTTRLLRGLNATWSDDAPSALESLSENTKHRVTQVAILLDDGTWLRCDDTTKFDGLPYSPCVIGPNGDIALYLTHEEPKDGQPRELGTVRDPHYGDRITYIPASRIKRMTLRHRKG